MALLFCERPHAKDVDFENSRFIVSTAQGLKACGQKFERGDEVPTGVLNARALREIYEPPLRLIETIEHARADEGLVRACETRGVNLLISTTDRC